MHDGHLLPVGIFYTFRLLEEGMGMPSQHQVDAVCLRHDGIVIHIIHTWVGHDPQVRQTNHHIALFLFTENHYHSIGHRRRLMIDNAFALALLHQSLELRTKGKDAYLHPIALEYHIGFYQSFEDGAFKVIVGTNDGEVGHLEKACHIVEAEIELMVADGHGIVLHQVHRLNLHLTLVKIVIRRALRDVATIEQQHIGVLLTELVDKPCPAGHTTDVGIPGRLLGFNGVDTAVGIAGV